MTSRRTVDKGLGNGRREVVATREWKREGKHTRSGGVARMLPPRTVTVSAVHVVSYMYTVV